MKTSILPSKVLILLAGACLVWITVLSLAFMALMGSGVTAGWIFAGALFLSLVVWTLVMGSEFRTAPVVRERCLLEKSDLGRVAGPLPRRANRSRSYRMRFIRPIPRRSPGFLESHPAYEPEPSDRSADS